MNFTANTLKYSLSWLTNQYITEQIFVSFSLSGLLHDGIDQSQSLSSPQRCKWQGLITYSSPGDCGRIDFQKYNSMFFCLWMVSRHSGGQTKQLRGVCVRSWQLSVTCQSHPSERRRCGERHGGRGGGGLISLSHLLLLSVSLSAYRALSDFLFSTHSLLRLTWITLVIKLTLDFKRRLPSWESDVLLIVCHFLDLSPPVFLPQAEKMNFMCCSNIPCTHAHIHIPVVGSLLKQPESGVY